MEISMHGLDLTMKLSTQMESVWDWKKLRSGATVYSPSISLKCILSMDHTPITDNTKITTLHELALQESLYIYRPSVIIL